MRHVRSRSCADRRGLAVVGLAFAGFIASDAVAGAGTGGPPGELDLSRATWVWAFPAPGASGRDGRCWLRGKLVLPRRPERAELAITADNVFELHINGRFAGSDADWRTVERYSVSEYLGEGPNVIAVRAENLGGPAGVIARLWVRLEDGEEVTLSTDPTWLSSLRPLPGWTEADHDDSRWPRAVELAPSGSAPWGALTLPAELSTVKPPSPAVERFTEPAPDYRWPAGIVFVEGDAPESSTPGAPRSVWPIGGSRAYFEHDTPAPRASGQRLWTLVPASPEGRPQLLVDAGEGFLAGPVSSYDGEEVVFAMAPAGEPYFKLYRIGADGSDLRRLTSGPWHDYDPAILPDGRIVFASTRIGSRDEYHGNTARSLFSLDAGRTRVEPLTHHIVGDSRPVVLADGRIAFVRSDNFMERAKVETQIHAVLPDGSSGEVLVGADRGAILYDRRSAAESSSRWLRNYGFGSPAPLPDGGLACISGDGPLLRKEGEGGFRPLPTAVPLFDLSSLPDGRLLASTAASRSLAILEPGSGEAVLLRRAAERPLHSPVYLGRRPPPPVRQGRALEESGASRALGETPRSGTLLCLNARRTRQTAADWRRVKAVRVFAARPLTNRPARHPYAHIGTEGIELGTVPLAPDGSFWVRVPADRALAIQMVDAEGRSVVNELTWIYARAGETRSCTGCHAPRERTPAARPVLATRAPPADLLPGAAPHRFRANNAANGGVLNLQFDRFREAASIDLYPPAALEPGADPAALPPARASEVERCARLLARGQVRERRSAARRLGVLRDRAGAPALERALGDRDVGVRSAAALALAACGTRRSVDALPAVLDDASPQVAQAAHVALEHLTGHAVPLNAYGGASCRSAGKTRWKSFIDATSWDGVEVELVGRLASSDPVRRRAAIEALGHIGGDAARKGLREYLAALSGRDLTGALAAIRALGHLEDERAVPLLATILLDGIGETPVDLSESHEFGWAQRPVQLAGAAAEALGWIGTPEAEQCLISAFASLSRFWYYTYRTGDHEWLKGCHTSIPHYRIVEALDAMASRGARCLTGALLRSLPMDADRGLLYGNDAYETLVARVIHRSGAAAEVVATCLAVLGDPQARRSPELEDAVTASPPAVSVGPLSCEARAAQVLSVVCLEPDHAPRVRAVLARYLELAPCRKRCWVAFYLARTLGKLADTGSVDALIDLVETEPPERSFGVPAPPNVFLHRAPTPLHRAAAADALGRIGASRAVPALLGLVADFANAMDVRAAAARALARAADASRLEEIEALARRYPEVATRRALVDAWRAARVREGVAAAPSGAVLRRSRSDGVARDPRHR